MAWMMGITRSHSSSKVVGLEPGREDCPPMSRMSMLDSTKCLAWAIAASTELNSPPSLKLSGVTLRTPIK